MRYIAAYLLLQLGGKASPTTTDIKTLLGTVGIDADEERLEALVSELRDKDVKEVCVPFLGWRDWGTLFCAL